MEGRNEDARGWNLAVHVQHKKVERFGGSEFGARACDFNRQASRDNSEDWVKGCDAAVERVRCGS